MAAAASAPPRASNGFEKTIGRGLAVLLNPGRTWRAGELGDRMFLVVAYSTASSRCLSSAESSRACRSRGAFPLRAFAVQWAEMERQAMER